MKMSIEMIVVLERAAARRLLDLLARTPNSSGAHLRARLTDREARLHLRWSEELNGSGVRDLLKAIGPAETPPGDRKKPRILAS